MKEQAKYSFSAASTFPMKLMLHEDLLNSCRRLQKVIPLHLQLNPTNLCNFGCPFCSCSNRDKNLSLSIQELRDLASDCHLVGTKAVTITGGGEPTLHKYFNALVGIFEFWGMDLGLVTNGTTFRRIEDETFRKLVWIRISASDFLPEQLQSIGKTVDDWLSDIEKVSKKHPLDWAFSYVVSKELSHCLRGILSIPAIS